MSPPPVGERTDPRPGRWRRPPRAHGSAGAPSGGAQADDVAMGLIGRWPARPPRAAQLVGRQAAKPSRRDKKLAKQKARDQGDIQQPAADDRRAWAPGRRRQSDARCWPRARAAPECRAAPWVRLVCETRFTRGPQFAARPRLAWCERRRRPVRSRVAAWAPHPFRPARFRGRRLPPISVHRLGSAQWRR